MDLQSQIGLLIIGQALTILAVLVTNYLNLRNNNRLLENELQIRKRVENLQEQLTRFYGPIYALLRINDAVLRIRYDPDTNQYTDKVPKELWIDIRDSVVVPNNKAMVEIIKGNFHLVEGNDIPLSVIEFIVHAEVWPRQAQYGMEQQEYFKQFCFPMEFKEYIYQTTNQLKEEYNLLVVRKNKKKPLQK